MALLRKKTQTSISPIKKKLISGQSSTIKKSKVESIPDENPLLSQAPNSTATTAFNWIQKTYPSPKTQKEINKKNPENIDNDEFASKYSRYRSNLK